jgi:hypothetical protein
MGYKDIKPGKYIAKPIAGKIGNSAEKGTPGFAVKFEFDRGDGNKEQLAWTGWLTMTEGKDGKTPMERTMETLALCGYDETKGNLPDGSVPQDYFDSKAEVEIVVEIEKYTAKDGTEKEAPRIKWVNKPGGSGFGLSDTQSVSNTLAGIDIKKEMMVARQKLGLKTTAPVKNYAPQTAAAASVRPGMAPTIDASEEIPF